MTDVMRNALFPYAESSNGMTVRVSATLLPEQSDPRAQRWFWAYHIRIENNRAAPAQLLARRWTIADANGALSRVEGEGVVGEQPVIQPGDAYDYVSGCPLGTSSGWMQGHYRMLDEEGRLFEIAIPRFLLSAPVD
jgi:ApaG protein